MPLSPKPRRPEPDLVPETLPQADQPDVLPDDPRVKDRRPTPDPLPAPEDDFITRG